MKNEENCVTSAEEIINCNVDCFNVSMFAVRFGLLNGIFHTHARVGRTMCFLSFHKTFYLLCAPHTVIETEILIRCDKRQQK